MKRRIVAGMLAAAMLLAAGCGGASKSPAADAQPVVPKHDDSRDEQEPKESQAEQAPEESSEATPTTIMYLDPDMAYWMDLDGNGVEEPIMYTITRDWDEAYDLGQEVIVKIGGQIAFVAESQNGLSCSMVIADFDSTDSFLDIVLNFTSESDCFEEFQGYQYDGADTNLIFDMLRDEDVMYRGGINELQPGDGSVCLSGEFMADGIGQGYAKLLFKIERGQLQIVPMNERNVTEDWELEEYHSQIALDIYDAANGGSKVGNVEAGEVFYVRKLYYDDAKHAMPFGISRAYIKTENGEEGWIILPADPFVEEYYPRSWG